LAETAFLKNPGEESSIMNPCFEIFVLHLLWFLANVMLCVFSICLFRWCLWRKVYLKHINTIINEMLNKIYHNTCTLVLKQYYWELFSFFYKGNGEEGWGDIFTFTQRHIFQKLKKFNSNFLYSKV